MATTIGGSTGINTQTVTTTSDITSGNDVTVADTLKSATDLLLQAENGPLRLFSGTGTATEAVRIQDNQRVIVGDTFSLSAISPFHIATSPVSRNSNSLGMSLYNTGDDYSVAPEIGIQFGAEYTGGTVTDLAHISGGKQTTSSGNYNGVLRFKTRTNGSANIDERMTIYGNGAISVNNSFSGTAQVDISTGVNDRCIQLRDTATSSLSTRNMLRLSYTASSNPAGATPIQFEDSAGTLGSISTNGSNIAYNTSSDYRLKENISEITDGISRVKTLIPSRFNFIKNPEETVDGFIAHEVSVAVPEAVSGEKDAIEPRGNITDINGTVIQENVVEPSTLNDGETWTKTHDAEIYQGIDQSKLVPLLTAALKESIAKIEVLEAKVAALESA